jgi:hypothetical protein
MMLEPVFTAPSTLTANVSRKRTFAAAVAGLVQKKHCNKHYAQPQGRFSAHPEKPCDHPTSSCRTPAPCRANLTSLS